MASPCFVSYYGIPGPNCGWYSTVNPGGFDLSRQDWATRYDPLRFGPFTFEEEAQEAIDDFLSRTGLDMKSLSYAAFHAKESLEADKEHYQGAELAKRRFQLALRGMHKACAYGNPPPEIVGLAVSHFFKTLCSAYPTAGSEMFRQIGNMYRESLEIPTMEYGERPEYAEEASQPEDSQEEDCEEDYGGEEFEEGC